MVFAYKYPQSDHIPLGGFVAQRFEPLGGR
jgi:hypothetical protein